MEQITFKTLYDEFREWPLLDVRSPGEFERGHVPFALSLPLFTDEERSVIGTLYKKSGQHAAMLKGLELAGAKMKWYAGKAGNLVSGNHVAVHCWRGGKRSESMGTLLRFLGFDVRVLKGGYKAYRNFILSEFENKKLNIIVLGGKTGSGKTELLHQLQDQGEQVIDLEGLAHHKGSAFGALGEAPQPTTEQFENDLYEVFRTVDPGRRVWIENESRSIGRVFVPQGLWNQMCHARFIDLDVSFDHRVERLVQDYGAYGKEELIASLQRIEKRLGGLRMQQAREAFESGDLKSATSIALQYYDKAYALATSRKTFSHTFAFKPRMDDLSKTAKDLIDYVDKYDH